MCRDFSYTFISYDFCCISVPALTKVVKVAKPICSDISHSICYFFFVFPNVATKFNLSIANFKKLFFAVKIRSAETQNISLLPHLTAYLSISHTFFLLLLKCLTWYRSYHILWSAAETPVSRANQQRQIPVYYSILNFPGYPCLSRCSCSRSCQFYSAKRKGFARVHSFCRFS